jgi:tagaturonate reductase
MILSRNTLKNISHDAIQVPEEKLFNLPEKVLQFGTGVLLRGLPDYFIDKANRQGIFNGRVVVVKSTSHGDTTAFDKQDGLFTHCVRGLENGKKVEENIINASLSRVLSAPSQWDQVLQCAHDENMQIIISNTTEVGIQLVNEDIQSKPPSSYPGKVLAFLFERYKAFKGSEKSGMVIIPTELIVDNGKKLKAIVLELARFNGLEDSFMQWIEQYNYFCSSLVDRIVPGQPDPELQTSIEKEFGYTDQLMTMSEVYRLWAVEGDEHIKRVVSFYRADEGLVITPDINLFRELKLRLLNGTHTLSCGIAVLYGCQTVKEAMEDDILSPYIADLMQQELASSIPYEVDQAVALEFTNKVLDRFRNPHIRHNWINITVQYSSKMKMRNIPILLQHYKTHTTPPALFSLGFASYIVFMRPFKKVEEKYYGIWNGMEYLIQDDMAEVFYKRMETLNPDQLTETVLKDSAFWGQDLTKVPGFEESVRNNVNSIINSGMKEALESVQSKKELV